MREFLFFHSISRPFIHSTHSFSFEIVNSSELISKATRRRQRGETADREKKNGHSAPLKLSNLIEFNDNYCHNTWATAIKYQNLLNVCVWARIVRI